MDKICVAFSKRITAFWYCTVFCPLLPTVLLAYNSTFDNKRVSFAMNWVVDFGLHCLSLSSHLIRGET